MLIDIHKDFNAHSPDNRKWLKILGFALIAFSYILYAGLLFVPFSSFSIATKGVICTLLLIIKELSWWIGVFIVGKEFLFKYFKNISLWTNRKQNGCGQSKITSEDRLY